MSIKESATDLHEKWRKEREAIKEAQTKAISKGLEDQVEAIKETYAVMDRINNDYCEMYDISSESMRNLQNALWKLRSGFNLDTKDEE